MELDDEDQLDQIMPIQMPDLPRFPCGLCISVTDRELGKMKPPVDATGAVLGALYHLHGMARVTHVSHGPNGSRIELQIEDLEMESEDAENKPAKTARRRGMYGKGDE